MSRFDNIPFDEQSRHETQTAMNLFREMEAALILIMGYGRASSIVLTHLEDAAMWVNKAIKGRQMMREAESEDECIENKNA